MKSGKSMSVFRIALRRIDAVGCKCPNNCCLIR